jgi:flavorubredoxin
MERAPQAKVFITEQGKSGIVKHYHKSFDFQVVKEGDVLDLGKNKLHFVPLPMLHWPDSMASYLDGEQILFSNDAFGQHICTSKRFDDENDLHAVLYEAAKYYANILMPFGKLVGKALGKTGQLPIKMIAPSHGVVWRTHLAEILAKYEAWGSGATQDKIIIVNDSMWGSTDQMARSILDGVAASGVSARLFKISVSDRSEVAMELLEARGLILGSSTHNNGVLATIGGLITYFKGLKPKGKLGAAFGAYGWGGGAQKELETGLKEMGMVVEPGVSLKWVPDQEELDKCFQFGLAFGKKVLAAK